MKKKKRKSFRDHTGGCYYRREDFNQPDVMTIKEAREEEVKPPNKEAEIKWVLYFEDRSKGIPVNQTNGEFMERLTGSENPEDWVGVTIEAFNDLSVRAPDGSKGGIRFREPKEEPIPY
jgi:hypothetical protein